MRKKERERAEDGRKRVVFITGTRADYGKMKPLMKALNRHPLFDVHVFVCGMHLSGLFGSTYREVLKDGYPNTHVADGLPQAQNPSVDLGNTVAYLSGYIENIRPDMIIVHGDRLDALAGAIVGTLHNVLVGHVEGGELSGTIDESIRHAISKFAHVHFVCTEEARRLLLQMGEEPGRIHVIGSPDIDVMKSEALPTLAEAKERYEIDFDRYGILMYHPVTTEHSLIGAHAKVVADAVLESGKNYIVVYPNNDLGYDIILSEYGRFEGDARFRVFPSLRFEHFLTLLKHAEFIIGNSSAGIRESGVYGIPAIDIGTRQTGRYSASQLNLQHVEEDKAAILDAIGRIRGYLMPSFVFGDGSSAARFLEIVKRPEFWQVKIQKSFVLLD